MLNFCQLGAKSVQDIDVYERNEKKVFTECLEQRLSNISFKEKDNC